MTEISRDGSSAVVKPGADIVASNAKELREELKNLIDLGIRELVVDLGAVEMIDSVGLGLLIAVHNSLSKTDGTLTVINASKDLEGLFKSMRLDRHFAVRGR